MADETQPANAEEAAPGAADETETTAPADDGAEAPAGGAPAEAPAEGDPAETQAEPEAAKPTEIPEETLKAAALRFANRTMAAARRAQAQVEAVRGENARLKEQIGQRDAFIGSVKTDPVGFLRALSQYGIGDGSVKGFVQHIIDHGKEPAAPSADDRVTALEKRLETERAARAEEQRQANIEASRKAVFAAVDKETARYDLATSDEGHEMLWDAIVAYHDEHGDCPDEAVWMLADEVEKRLEAKITSIKSRKFTVQRQDAKKQGATAAEGAATAARTGGKKTLTNGATAGAPGSREYSLDPDVRRKQVTEDMRAAGEL